MVLPNPARDAGSASVGWNDARARAVLRRLFDAAVAAADPRLVLAGHLPAKPKGRCVVVGGGKSAALMAAALEAAWPDVALEGTVVTRYGHAVPTRQIEVIEASHPVPDAAGERGARRLLERVRGLSADDLVLALISGGGSALLALGAPGITLADKQAVNRALLASGATIGEMNTVRKHLSAIKGGRLAQAAVPARVVTLAISDVPGDDPAVIASGPTVPDPTTFADAREILARYGIVPAAQVAARLAASDLAAAAEETPKPGQLPHADFRLIATPMMALRAAAAAAREAGVTPLILGDALEGESREMGTVMAGLARSVRAHGEPLAAPAVLLSGGETTVTIGAGPAGQGGRNTEFLLGLALALGATPGIWAVAGDTDGIDGTEDAAGALVGPDTLARARAAGLDPRAVLAGHDSYRLFAALDDLIRTGPTLTNVNDIRAVLIAPVA
ncbi:MAG: glycerate kinase [Rhodospirillales bacterium]|jgi:hydroxypyruvate reductase|nr:glycerate kinase [Rhodospirillales bacterium]